MGNRAATRDRTVLSLFTGAGGLDLGLEASGFSIRLCVEIHEDARKTLAANRPDWKLSDPGDIHLLDPEELVRQAGVRRRKITLLTGGPPCQPFSKSGYWSNGDSGRLKDPRSSTLRAYLRVLEAALPQVLLLENVKGLAFAGKDEGVQLLREEVRAINRRQKTKYQLQVIHLNAANYGVPQIRERVFVLASIDGRTITAPSPTHGPAILENGKLEVYRTAWDAIGHLDHDEWPADLKATGKWAGLLPSIPEGQNYLWHTHRSDGQPLFGWRTRFWSFLLKLAKDQPSWTIQAEPGPATGPFHWRSRLLSIEELCRLQTFPKGYRIEGSRRSAHRQVGNAVPSALGELLGLHIRRELLGEKVRHDLHLIPPRRDQRPGRESLGHVPKRYLELRGAHADHPGIGLGRAALVRVDPQSIAEG
jgi:DNA (cytosine-5)-methyltransferase 1